MATIETFDLWRRRYLALPAEPLETEVDIAATARRRSRGSPPGRCYAMAGWSWHRTTLAGHGRPTRAIYRSPSPEEI